MLGRRPGRAARDKGVNRLLLPWPLRVRESDFRPLPGSVDGLFTEPNGFFEFAPSERLDLDLVERMLIAAHDQINQVDGVVLPESAVEEDEIDDLETVLSQHGVIGLVSAAPKRKSSSPARQSSTRPVVRGCISEGGGTFLAKGGIYLTQVAYGCAADRQGLPGLVSGAADVVRRRGCLPRLP